MNRLINILLFFLLISCTTGTYTNRSSDNSNLSFDKSYCKLLARSKYPGYICKKPLMCATEEFTTVINELAKYEGVFQNCMIKKNYNYN